MASLVTLWTQPRSRLADYTRWFTEIAQALIHQHSLMVNNQPHRITEIEFYWHSTDHPDPFPHRSIYQQRSATWYLHRNQNTLRNGSFKGIDITFGDKPNCGGILLRSLQISDNQVIHGPSCCVDYLMEQTDCSSIQQLDHRLQDRSIWDSSCPIYLGPQSWECTTIYSSARVGLSLKKPQDQEQRCRFIGMPYRFFLDPWQLKKGRVPMILSLYQTYPESDLPQRSGSSASTIRSYIQAYHRGQERTNFQTYFGLSLNNHSTAELLGTWNTVFGQSDYTEDKAEKTRRRSLSRSKESSDEDTQAEGKGQGNDGGNAEPGRSVGGDVDPFRCW